MSAPIRCTNLSKHYRGTVALDGVHLKVPEGSIYALIGPNGAGKTTLIKILVNLLRPNSGNCFVFDKDTRWLQGDDFCRLGYVSENQQLPEWMTVGYFLRYLKSFYPRWDDVVAAEMLREFALPLEQTLGSLSRGMRMKAALVASLAYHPDLLILDEPFSGLDPLVRDDLVGGLLARAGETTILISSHELAEVETFASHVGFLQAGRLQFSEEITTLQERFREISIATGRTAEVREGWRPSWLRAERSEATVRIVESQFEPGSTEAAIARCFPSPVSVSIRALSLREIFIALARSQGSLKGERE